MQKKICFWGHGYPVHTLIPLCEYLDIVPCAIFDNDTSKYGDNILGVEVVSPKKLGEINPDYIIITSKAHKEITAQAVSLGYEAEKMVAFYDISDLVHDLDVFNYLWCYNYSCDGQATCNHLKTYRIRGKVTRDVPSPVPLPQQRRIVARCLDAFVRAVRVSGQVPPAYRVGENWGDVFAESRGPLYALARAGDVDGLTDLLANFCRNGLGSSIIGDERMFRSFAAGTRRHSWLQHNLEVWASLLDGEGDLGETAMPPIGNPYGYDVDGHLINWNSFINHARATRCLRLLEDCDRPVIGEIGGGFGGFAYQLLRRDIPLTYVNFDLPENLFISSYYLSMAFPEKRILLYEGPDMSLDPAVLRQYDAVMLPNFMLPAMPAESIDYLLNTISFSEMEYATICEYFSQVDRVVSRYFYHENLSCHPDYKGFPSAVFPKPRHFRQVFASFSPWMGLDAYACGHSYMERLYMRPGAIEPLTPSEGAHAS